MPLFPYVDAAPHLDKRVYLHESAQLISNDCLVGLGSIVMDDVIVEDRTMISAGSLVPPGKTLQSGFLYVGRPVKKVRPLTDAGIANLRYSAEHCVRVKDNYLQGQP